MKLKRFPAKATEEAVPLIFDFTKVVTAIDSAVFSITQVGPDPDTAQLATMLYGAGQVTGAQAVQLVQGGGTGLDYVVKARIASGSEVYVLEGLLPVR